MSCHSFEQARDEVYELLMDAWTAGAPAVCGYVPKMFWKEVTPDEIPNKSQYWVKFAVNPVISPQTALGMGTAPEGNRRFTTYGLVIAQVMCPANLVEASLIGIRLSQIVQSALRRKSTPNNVWFRNARINLLDQKEGYERFNVVAEMQYDEIA
jgi:hypothetical protein